jgi:endonuclease YncB( thermonuclease family)
MKTILLFALAGGLGAQTFSATVEGPPHDGDTLPVKVQASTNRKKVPLGSAKIRLWLADAPELRQDVGENARRSLAGLVPIGAWVRCAYVSKSVDRLVADCSTGKSGSERNLSEHQVSEGWALVWTPERGKAADWAGWRPKGLGRSASPPKIARYTRLLIMLDLERAAADKMAGAWAGLGRAEKPQPAWLFRKGRR